MPAIRPVTVDLATGVVTIGGTRVHLACADGYFTAPGGFRARALTFAERSSIVAGALIDPEPQRALLTKLRALAAPAYDKSDQVTDALILALAGGGESAGSFSDCARDACRKQGTDWQAMQQSPAVLVDQIASQQPGVDGETGWTRFEFREAPQDLISVEDCCRLMLEQLLERGMPMNEAIGETSSVGSKGWCAAPHAGHLISGDDVNSRGGRLADDPAQSNTLASWPGAVQSPRLRAILPLMQPPPDDRAQPRPKRCFVTGTVRSNSDGAEETWRQSAAPGLQYPESRVAHASLRDAGKPAAKPSAPSQTSKAITTTLRDTAAASPAAPVSALSTVPMLPNSKAAAPKAWLPDAPPQTATTALSRGEASALSPRPTMSDLAATHPTTPLVASQRDWIYEIATALADECDLRGLDT